ncbi:hypothetical protein HGM15179_010429 [Zosterops borbonicus]|uniref:Uncharacterized protein n=1 Tax=Zosterops borbonicus TaxID=364589 RepID=A0A8K1GDD7_9PASS|nr:hypothetical protein HGM15179_010429 [Zosterops borbonicus]
MWFCWSRDDPVEGSSGAEMGLVSLWESSANRLCWGSECQGEGQIDGLLVWPVGSERCQPCPPIAGQTPNSINTLNPKINFFCFLVSQPDGDSAFLTFPKTSFETEELNILGSVDMTFCTKFNYTEKDQLQPWFRG